MICKKLRFKKQIISLLMSAVMTTSAFVSTPAKTYADEKTADNSVTNYEKKESTLDESSVDLDVESHFTGDLSEEDVEFEDAITSEELINMAQEDCAVPKAGANEVLPQAVDNSESIYFPEIGDQDHIGSCVGWSEVYYGFTYANCRAKNVPATGNNIMSPAFVYNQIKGRSGGAYPPNALTVLLTEGAPSKNTADFESYKQEERCRTWFPEKDIWLEAEKTRLTSFAVIDNPGTISSNHDEDLNEMKELLNDGFLINCSSLSRGWIGATCDESGSHAGELIVKKAVYAPGGHRITIVGYDDNVCVDINEDGIIEEAEKGAFKVANSWGKEWGNDGFMWFSYDSLNEKSQVIRTLPDRMISLYNFSVQYVADGGEPCSDVNLVMTLNTKTRYEARVYISATDVNGNVTKTDFTATNTDNELNYSLDGSNEANDGVVLFNLDNIIEGITAQTVGDYVWSVKVEDTYEDEYVNVLKDAHIEADGETVLAFDNDEISVNGNADTKNWNSNKKLNINWDIEGNDSTVGVERTITADGIGNSADATYKFVAACNGQTSVLKDYSSSNECTFIPQEAGSYVISVYANVNGEELKDRSVFEINAAPSIEKIQYTPSNYWGAITNNYVNEKIGMEAVVKGGTGNVTIEEMYVTGGDYEDGSHRFNLSLNDDQTATWSADKEGQYSVYVKAKDEVGATVEFTSDAFTINPARPMEIINFPTYSSSAELFDDVKFSASAVGGSGEFEYRFGTIFKGKIYEISDGYTDASEVVNNFSMIGSLDGVTQSAALVGENTVFVEVRDKVTNEVLRKTQKINVHGMRASGFAANTTDYFCCVGNEVEVALPMYSVSPDGYTEKVFSYVYDGVETVIDNSTESHKGLWGTESAIFIPEKAGEYTIKFHAVDAIGQEVNYDTNIRVTGYKATVYYDNATWNDAYVHYCVDGEKWTAVPGVKMEESDVEGYKWKAVIDLSNHSGAQVCFNNGNNSWDSCNGSNYRVGKGTYYIKNGNVSKKDINISLKYNGYKSYNEIQAIVKNSTRYVKYHYKVYIDGSLYDEYSGVQYLNYDGLWNIYSKMYIEGTYRFEIEIEDENGDACSITEDIYSPGAVIELTPDKEGNYKVGEQVTVTAMKYNFYVYSHFYPSSYWYVLDEDDEEIDFTRIYEEITFTPTKAGVYTVVCYVPDAAYGPVIQTLDITVTDEPDNTVVVYYNNSNWADANIHYGINGVWTDVPGVAMQPSDNPKYTWKYVIDLGDADSVQVCFNNGKGQWDSRNGANYTLIAGSYSIVNGQIYNA